MLVHLQALEGLARGLRSIVSLPATSAKSRRRRRRRLAMRGVPRARPPISRAASGVIWIERIRAERSTIFASAAMS